MKELKNKTIWVNDHSRNSRHLEDGEEIAKDVGKNTPVDHSRCFLQVEMNAGS